jgi:ABC-type glycerol-3-phosphate transport system substrate-binding protein
MPTYTRVDPVFVEVVIDAWTQQNGGSIMELMSDGTPVYASADNEEAREALQLIVDNIYDYACFAPPSLDGSMDSMTYSNQIGMWWSHGGHISRYRRAAPELNFSVAVMPRQKRRTTYIADNKFMVPAQTKVPDEAWEYIRFFTGKEAEAMFAPYEGHISVWQDNWDLPAYEHEGYQGLIEQLLLEDTLPYQAHPGWEATRGA